jgi:hypothetical protein
MIRDTGSLALQNASSPLMGASKQEQKEPASPSIDTKDTMELAGNKDDSTGMYMLKNFGKAALMIGKGALWTVEGVALEGYRFAKGFCKGVGKVQEHMYGKIAGMVGLSAFPVGAAAAVTALSLGAAPVGVALAGAAGLFWAHTGGGIIYGLKEMVVPGK